MFAIKPSEQNWTSGIQPGVERAVLWEVPGGGRTSLIRMTKGATIEMHGHLGKEEVYVVSGRLRISDATLEAGDYHHTGPGERHEVLLFESQAQAEVRCLSRDHNRGDEAAQTALEMARIMRSLG